MVPANTSSGRQYWRCINAGQWQNAANIRGVSVDQVRRDHDTGYLPPIPVAQSSAPTPLDWRVTVVRRLHRLKVSRREFCARMGRSYTSLEQYACDLSREPSAAWLASLLRDLRALETEIGA